MSKPDLEKLLKEGVKIVHCHARNTDKDWLMRARAAIRDPQEQEEGCWLNKQQMRALAVSLNPNITDDEFEAMWRERFPGPTS